jgi:hypothetical protein
LTSADLPSSVFRFDREADLLLEDLLLELFCSYWLNETS